ncbi:putative orfan [Tupanvirus soda lake]|uniref:Orfan n=2 Tax=Tupanvirus TaxID=2094720 RepID=A0AC62ACI3_9VIRU|nr:putative orfan [Tupanvirus soda lake]QKU35419.1 putative orfan [Tupanvirus soda lake]
MSVSIIENLPDECHLQYFFSKYCKLYKQNSLRYVCSIVVPWYSDKEMFFSLELEKDTIKKFLSFPNGFTLKEYNLFSKIVVENCESINQYLENIGTDPRLDNFFRNIKIEKLCFAFFANELLLKISRNMMMQKNNFKWDRENQLLYCLAQILHSAYAASFFRQNQLNNNLVN